MLHRIDKIYLICSQEMIIFMSGKSYIYVQIISGLAGGSDGHEYACNARDPGSIPRLGRSRGEGNGNTFQYSCQENSMDRGAWWATDHGVEESDTTEQLHFHFFFNLKKPSILNFYSN